MIVKVAEQEFVHTSVLFRWILRCDVVFSRGKISGQQNICNNGIYIITLLSCISSYSGVVVGF